MSSDFDIAAADYDTLFTNSKIGKSQRQTVYRHLDPILKTNKTLSILEVNCGTGRDAIYFSNFGHQVLATDISKEMIAIANAKTHSKRVSFKSLDINSIAEELMDKSFNLIVSNFGGLNCLSPKELKRFFVNTSSLLEKNGQLILVIMPKHCLWERFYFFLKGDKAKAKRRNTKNYVNANVEGVSVKTWYYNPDDISQIAKHDFNIDLVKSIGLTIPPSYLEKSILTKFPLFQILKSLEYLFTGKSWAKYADHFLIVLSKK